jgi:methionine synthase II (cobalamin-independent)
MYHVWMFDTKIKQVSIEPFTTTGIGSLPHTEAREAVKLVLKSFDIPFWPQLPRRSSMELMIPQYSEGMPCIRVDSEGQDVWFERNEEEIERFYEGYTEEAKIAVSVDYARGFYEFLKALRGRRRLLKGHITGPLTFSLGIKDSEGRLLYFDEELRELCLMLLKAKARWQVDALGPYADEVIIFIDEPVLSALGSSAYLGVSREEALRLLTETAGAIKAAGGIPGIHCCGRAEWPLVMETGVTILNFDAYEFGDTIGIYPEETRAFLEKGGLLAWGIVPTTESIRRETEESIRRLFNERLEALSGQVPEDLLLRNIILTPSCGTGSLSVDETLKVFQILMRLKEEVSR